MPRLSPLPERLKYLQPLRKLVANLKPEDIDESMDLSVLNSLLRHRIERQSPEAGKRTLQEDQEALEKWLKSPNLEDNGAMYFLRGYLMALPELVDHLLEIEDKPQQRAEIYMELPAEAKIKKRHDNAVLEVGWLGAKLWVSPTDKNGVESEVRNFLELARTPFVDVVVLPVVFGNVGGVKKMTHRSDSKSTELEYALQVPGGYATIGLVKRGTGLLESKFEQYFHTMRIVHG